jgi:hypothetical protein
VLLPLVLVLVLVVLPLLLVMDALNGLLFLRLAVAMLFFCKGEDARGVAQGRKDG